jgi:O-antigen/teichoic acid export membrane protein
MTRVESSEGLRDAAAPQPDIDTPPDRAADGGRDRGARAVVLLATAEVVGKVATLALLVYAVRLLVPADFGSFSYALAFGALLAVLPAWGLDPLLVQQVGSDRSRLGGAYTQLLILRTLLALPVLAIGGVLGAATRPTPEARFVLVAMLAAAVLESYAHGPRAVAGVLRRQSTVAVVLVVQRALTAVAAGGALAAGLGVVGMSAAYLLMTLVGTVALFVTVGRMGGRPSLSGLTLERLRRTARQSVPLGVDALVAMVLFRADALLLGWFHGDAAVGEYTAAYRLVETVLFVTWAVSRVVYPAMAAAPDSRALRGALSNGLAVIGFVFVPFAALVIVRAGDLLGLLFGDHYADASTTVLRVLAPVPLVFAVGFLISYAFVAQGRSGITLATSVVAAVVNVLGNLLLLPSLSTLGAALTATGSYLLEAVLLAVLARRQLGRLRLLRTFAVPAVAAVPAAGVALLPLAVLPALLLAGLVYLLGWGLLARRWQPEHVSVLRTVVPIRRPS